MPNWCSNKLTVSHRDPSKIKTLVAAFKDSKFCESVVPLPNGEWNYDFCVNKWGTKWEVSGEVELETETTAEFYFDSAWAPPVGVYQALCADGYEVTAYYEEGGMQYCGKITGDEDSFDDDYHEYGSLTSDQVRDLIGEELDDMFCISERLAEYEAERLDDEEVSEEELIDELERIRNIGPHTD